MEINDFVLNNFPGNALHHRMFIVLDRVTAEDGSTCLLVHSEFRQRPPFPGFLRDIWPQVFLTAANIDNCNMDFEEFAMAAADHHGIVDLE